MSDSPAEGGAATDLRLGLERILRARAGAAGLRVVAPLVPLSGGFDTEIYACEIGEPPAGLPARLVLRLFGSAKGALRAEIEAAIHNAAHAAGLPVPEVFATSADGLIGGRAFMVMARASGLPMVDAPTDVPRLLAETLVRIHRLDVALLHRVIEATGADPGRFRPERLLHRIDRLIEAARLSDLAPVAAWLHRREALGSMAAVICHGDLHPGNLMVDRGQVSGIIDWSNTALAPPEWDVAVTRLILSIVQGNLPALSAAGASRDLGAGAAEAFLARYRAQRPLDGERLDYYTVLRAAHPLIEVAALRRDPGLRAEITEGEAWQRANLIAPVRDTVARLTGVRIDLPCC